jgi:hypothetical protein
MLSSILCNVGYTPRPKSFRLRLQSAEAEFLDVIGTSLLFTGTSTNQFYTPSPPLRKSGLKLFVMLTISRLCPETSTKLYVHEFGFCS